MRRKKDRTNLALVTSVLLGNSRLKFNRRFVCNNFLRDRLFALIAPFCNQMQKQRQKIAVHHYFRNSIIRCNFRAAKFFVAILGLFQAQKPWNKRISTKSPACTSVCSCLSTIMQLASDIERKMPDPCDPVTLTSSCPSMPRRAIPR